MSRREYGVEARIFLNLVAGGSAIENFRLLIAHEVPSLLRLSTYCCGRYCTPHNSPPLQVVSFMKKLRMPDRRENAIRR
jgi:hypothetical protein